MITSDNAKTVVIIAGVGVLAYLAYKAYQGAQVAAGVIAQSVGDTIDFTKQTANNIHSAGVGGAGVVLDYLGGIDSQASQYLAMTPYQAGLVARKTEAGWISDGKTYDDMTGYVMPSTAIAESMAQMGSEGYL